MAWVIVGLGNPGEEYASTRHNTGRMAVEALAKKLGVAEFRVDTKAKAHTAGAMIGKSAVALVLPDTFMNKSGAALAKYVKSAKAAERMIVVYDELDLPLGAMKVSFDRGSGGHRGLESVMRAVKTRKFTRLRLGISPSTASGALRKPSGEKEVNDFILGTFKASEIAELKNVFKRACDAMECIVREGSGIAMNTFNS